MIRQEVAQVGGVEEMLTRRDRRIFRPNWVDDERLHSPAVAVLNSRVRAALRREEWPSILARERERERGPAVLEFVGGRGIPLQT